MKPFFLCGWSLALAGSALAVSPKLNSTTPSGGQRGTELELRFNGQRLSDTKEIIFYYPGIEAVKMEEPRSNSLKATIRIAKDCRLGEHLVRLRTATGVSDVRTFYVGPYPTVAEVEPNELNKPQTISMNSTISGVMASEDTDCFAVTAKQGERISAEIEGMRLGRSAFDPYVAIRDSAGKVLAKADDASLLMQDCYLSMVAPRDGDYVIEVRETSYGGNDNYQYRLHLGNFPRPSAVYPAGGKADDTVMARFIGDPAGDFSQEIKLPGKPQEKLGVFAEDVAPSPNWMRVSAFPNVLEVSPNQDREHATSTEILPPVALNGIISRHGESDWFGFKAKKGQALEVNVFARRLRSPLDSVLELFDANGKSIAANDDGAGADSVVKFTPSDDATYFLRIKDQLDQGEPDCVYRIEITPQQPAITLSIPQVARYDSQTRQYIAVPRGNRFATLISAKRSNLSGDLAFKLDGLPEGVSMKADTMSGKVDQMPLVFEATPDAPITGRLLDLTASVAGDGPSVEGKFRHDIELVQGPNNSSYYGTRADKLYVAVIEAAPYKLRIAEPKVPLVQAGTMDLKIIAEREPGFDEPITVRMIWNPPGVGALPDVTIPKGQESVLYRVNASRDAQTRSWKIAVLGSATVGGGPLSVSSQLADLVVGPPYLTAKIATSAVQPGSGTNVVVTLNQEIPFEGTATIKLLGLPEKISVTEQTISKDDKEVVFKVKADAACPTGSHKALFCLVEIMKDGEVIPHSVGNGGVLRVVPPKKIAASVAAQTRVASKTGAEGK